MFGSDAACGLPNTHPPQGERNVQTDTRPHAFQPPLAACTADDASCSHEYMCLIAGQHDKQRHGKPRSLITGNTDRDHAACPKRVSSPRPAGPHRPQAVHCRNTACCYFPILPLRNIRQFDDNPRRSRRYTPCVPARLSPSSRFEHFARGSRFIRRNTDQTAIFGFMVVSHIISAGSRRDPWSAG